MTPSEGLLLLIPQEGFFIGHDIAQVMGNGDEPSEGSVTEITCLLPILIDNDG